MYPSKLLKILATFTNQEIKSCKTFIESPFFNKREDLLQFYKYIIKYHPDYEDSKLEAEQVFQYMYPKQKFNEPKLRHLMSGLTKLLEQFLIQLDLQNSKLDQKRFLLKAYAQRNLRNYFDSNLKKHVQYLETQSLRNIEYYRHQHLIKYQIAEVYNEDSNNIIKAAEDLDIFYMTYKLRTTCLLVNFQRIYKIEFGELFLMPEIFKHIETNPELQEIPSIFVYYLIYKMLSAADKDQDQYFEELLKQISIYKTQFTDIEIDTMYSYAHNHCIKRVNQSNQNYRFKLFELYQIRLQNLLTVGQGNFPEWEYINIVRLCIDLKEIQFVRGFITKYENKIAQEEKNNAPNLAKAMYEFSQQNFAAAMPYLQKIKTTHSHYYVYTNTLMIKIYYELTADAPLESTINAFLMYLSRSSKPKLHPSSIERYKKLARFIKKLSRIKILIGKREKKKAKFSLQKIIDVINKDKEIADLDWLQEKINELLNNNLGKTII